MQVCKQGGQGDYQPRCRCNVLFADTYERQAHGLLFKRREIKVLGKQRSMWQRCASGLNLAEAGRQT